MGAGLKKKYVPLSELDVYRLSRELSGLCWEVYNGMDWKMRRNIGDQFIRSGDSVGANIAEGYGRFHYMDRIKFYYNARASLFESCSHWLELLKERNLIESAKYVRIHLIGKDLLVKLNNFIKTTYDQKCNRNTVEIQ